MRVKKKSDTSRQLPINPEAAAAVLATIAPPAFPTLPAEKRVSASPANPSLPAASAATEEPEKEENIYEVMKQHMKRQKEETDAKNAAMRTQRPGMPGVPGRPGPAGAPSGRPGPQQAPVAPPVERITDAKDLPGIWLAVRRWLSGPGQARYLESVLGHCCTLKSLLPTTGETVLSIPHNQSGFTNERARLKLEEALRAVTPFPIRLTLDLLSEEASPTPPPNADTGDSNNSAARRVPPEVIDAVNTQPIIQKLSSLLDGKVTSVELLSEEE